jgi:trans-aconitate methyltransferase
MEILILLAQPTHPRNNEYMEDTITQPTPPRTGQNWNTEAYAANGRFVADMASGVVDLLALQAGEGVLDLGCGDGALTEKLAATGAIVTGVDSSAAMVHAARRRNLNIDHYNAADLPYKDKFDAVFSNAALHWLPATKQPFVLSGVYRALKSGGRFVAEMGGQGNIAAIRTALQATLAPFHIDAEAVAESFYPSPSVYRRLLEAAGFTVQSIDLIPRPTPLPNGMDAWLNTFRNGVLDQLVPVDRATVLAQTVALLEPVLRDVDGNWVADYVRLRFRVIRQD